MKKTKFCMLMILDGWGISRKHEGNAVFLAKTPCLDNLKNEYPHTSILTSGKAVGLPDGIMGNSEVGHLNIGAGRIVHQDISRINNAIDDGTFFHNDALNDVMNKVKDNNSALHLLGLTSQGGVHSQLTHLFALLEMVRKKGLKQVYVHAILDGRDTPPDSGASYLKKLQEHIQKNNFGVIASICGRFYAMDRDNRWERVEKAFRLYVEGKAIMEANPLEAIKKAYARNEVDEFVSPIAMIDNDKKPIGIVRDDDGIIFFNFRSDRAREITRTFTDPNFDSFKRDTLPTLCGFVCMTLYDEKFNLPVAFPHVYPDEILGEVISKHELRQLRIAETEKYAHVTYFFNGGREEPFALEDRRLIPSPRDIATYDLKPEMSANMVADKLIDCLQSEKYDMIIVNFANMDMVGHTGILDAAIKACETVDKCVARIIPKVKQLGGAVLITADHGNAETMINENGQVHTAHTTNPVPLILVDDTRKKTALQSGGKLADIAPTMLHIMGINKPEKMTGQSLF